MRSLAAIVILSLSRLTPSLAHDTPIARAEPTYEITAPSDPATGAPSLLLHVLDGETGAPTPARFSISIAGKPYLPPALDTHGLRFISIHTAKKQSETVLYVRGTGPVALSLPAGAAEVELVVTKGYEYTPVHLSLEIPATPVAIERTATLRRWSHLRAHGWLAADEHLHYERSDPKHDADWFTMLAADGLDQGFFMVLDGGNLPGVWAEQYAYGEKGRARDPGSSIALNPGEEFRGTLQGHNNLHGIAKVLTPITVGRSKAGPESYNWPASHDVLAQVRDTGGIGGPAHGGTFGKASTVYLDAILGASEFIELANTHLYELDPWYRLLNCGYLLPPVAGTDLPNFPYRSQWQPFFGETRTCVKVDDPATADFDAWKKALRAGRVFITSGPLISLTIDGAAPGKTLRLPAGGESIEIVAELSSPVPLSEFEVVRNGKVLPVEIQKSRDADGIHRWKISHQILLNQSSWFAARGKGIRKNVLWAKTGILQHSIAHTAAIPVNVGDQPIFSAADSREILKTLRSSRAVYETEATYPDAAARTHMLSLFDEAIAALQKQQQL